MYMCTYIASMADVHYIDGNHIYGVCALSGVVHLWWQHSWAADGGVSISGVPLYRTHLVLVLAGHVVLQRDISKT